MLLLSSWCTVHSTLLCLCSFYKMKIKTKGKFPPPTDPICRWLSGVAPHMTRRAGVARIFVSCNIDASGWCCPFFSVSMLYGTRCLISILKSKILRYINNLEICHTVYFQDKTDKTWDMRNEKKKVTHRFRWSITIIYLVAFAITRIQIIDYRSISDGNATDGTSHWSDGC